MPRRQRKAYGQAEMLQCNKTPPGGKMELFPTRAQRSLWRLPGVTKVRASDLSTWEGPEESLASMLRSPLDILSDTRKPLPYALWRKLTTPQPFSQLVHRPRLQSHGEPRPAFWQTPTSRSSCPGRALSSPRLNAIPRGGSVDSVEPEVRQKWRLRGIPPPGSCVTLASSPTSLSLAFLYLPKGGDATHFAARW